MKKVERNKYRKKVNTNDKAFVSYLHNCPEEPVSEFVNALDDCEFNDKWRRVLEPEKEYYHYHPDHLGSSSWITNQRGTPVQHIQYLPFGETWTDQRSANWNAPYTFSGKEKDWETSYHYYGARYYDSDLSIWLSIDPLASKYPSLSPYVYCADNPVKLIDPNGMEVEYASFFDRINVFLTRVFNPEFRKNFKELKNSKETYVFKENVVGDNSFTTDGNKLFINYSLVQGDKEAGYTLFSNMRHETEHAMQFEYGEIGFANTGGEWTPVNYDINDEIKAQDVAASGSCFRSGPIRNRWSNSEFSRDQKIETLRKSPEYSEQNLPSSSQDNSNTQRIKSQMFYMLPKRER